MGKVLPVMAFVGVGKGWQCQICKFNCRDLDKAVLHADKKHGAESAWNDEMDIYDAKDPEVLRMMGRL